MLASAIVISVTGGIKKEFSRRIISFGVTSTLISILPSNMFWMFCILIFILGTREVLISCE